MFSKTWSSHGWLPYCVIIVFGSMLFFPFLGSVHLFDWDEINFAESAREMLATGNYTQVQINFQPFWEKPALFFWMQALSMKLFGINEFAARFPNAVCGIVTLCFIFFIGKKHFSAAFGWWWVLAYIGSFLPHFYFKSGIIDPWFNLFIFSGIYFLFVAVMAGYAYSGTKQSLSLKNMVFAGICIGLAVLTKGPVGLLIATLTAIAFVLLKSDSKAFHPIGILIFGFCVLLVSFFWYGLEVLKNGTWFPEAFIRYQIRLFQTPDSGHGGPFYYHALVLLSGCFPASFFAVRAFFRKDELTEQQRTLRLWMLLLFLVTLVLFSIVKTKIIHYSSLCYLPLTFMAALSIYVKQQKSKNEYSAEKWLLLFFGIIIGLVFALVPVLGNNLHLIEPYIKDPFAKAAIQVKVNWHWWLPVFGLFSVAVTIYVFVKWKYNFQKSVWLLFISNAMLIFFIMLFFVPRIERYSQGSAIDFYKSLQGKDVYVEVSGYKSYAQYFYTMKQPASSIIDKNAMLYHEIDKPVYMVTKIHKAEKFQQAHPLFIKVHKGGGFVMFRRD
jgi:4-amino-4-deoxy-L-arabinose transferase-like glycosyltransferase